MKELAPRTTTGRGRLLFAMDATMSRQPTWDMALALQADMFHAVKAVGGLDVQLIYFRGAGECRASGWVSDPDALAALMTRVTCAGGYTQIGKVLSHARTEAAKKPVNALVYVGDCMEENIDDLCGRAGELALLGVPVFLFQEGADARAEKAFREIARLTKGAYCRFDAGSAAQLRELLSAVAVYAAGGRKALAGAQRARRPRPAAAAQVGRRACHAVPAAGPGGAAAVPAGHARLHHGQPAGAGAPADDRRRRRGAGGGGHPRGARLVGYAMSLAALGSWLLWGTGGFPWGGPFGRAQKSPGQTSRVATEHLEVELDHDTGEMRGRVLKGAFAGRLLEDLAPADMAHLWQDCRFSDPQSAQILEAYLDRAHPSWRDDLGRTEGGQAAAPAGHMTREEALEVLGLREPAPARTTSAAPTATS